MQTETFQPGHPDYKEFARLVDSDETNSVRRNRSRLIYNDIAERYNEAAVESVIKITNDMNVLKHNLVRIVENRGLVQDVDFILTELKKDLQGNKLKEPVFLMKKISTVDMRLV